MKLSELITKYHRFLAAALLLIMFGLGVGSMAKDSGIVDEVAHIPAGYSYLKYGDFRLNPEHPPLIKDLAALPLLFFDYKFPLNIAAWTTDANGQWEAGWHFIYHIGNDADQILFLSRLPILLLALAFGWVLYLFALRRYGPQAAILTLFFYALCPNIIAHSRFVTTDLGAAAFFFFSIISFVKFLESPTRKNIIIATVLFATAQLAKFSAIILVPFYLLLAAIAIFAWQKPGSWKDRASSYVKGMAWIFIGGALLIWLVYIPHTIGMPLEVQDKLIAGSLPGGWPKAVGDFLASINHLPLVKPLAQYLLGLLMVFNRVAGGNTTYFLGEVTNQSFVWYFPVTYLLKTPVSLLALILIGSVVSFLQYFYKTPAKIMSNLVNYSRKHFMELSSLLFIAFYSYLSITGNLNLGIRHLMPIMPFVFLIVAIKSTQIVEMLKKKAWPKVVLGLLLGHYLITNLLAYPSYLTYFNELGGGPGSAYKYLSDSNVDWGQDLRRLKEYVDAHPEITNIAVDYFGGGEPKYYFCDRRIDDSGKLIADVSGYDCLASPFVEWHADYGVYEGDYIAVSETFLMNDIYWAPMRGDDGYARLRQMEPIAKIGYSIYVYKLR